MTLVHVTVVKVLAAALLTLSLVALPVRADDDAPEGDGLAYPVVAGALTLGVGTVSLLGGALLLAGGVFFYTNPTTFESDDNSTLIASQALLVAGGLGIGLGLVLAGGGAGVLVGHTFFE